MAKYIKEGIEDLGLQHQRKKLSLKEQVQAKNV